MISSSASRRRSSPTSMNSPIQHSFGGEDQRLLVRDAFDQAERRRDDVHLPIADQDVAIAAKSFNALVLVRIFMVGVQEIAVADDQVEHGIGIAVGLLRVAAEDIVDGPPVVEPRGDLAVAVEAGIAARVGQPFQLVAFGSRDHAEVGIAVPPAGLEVQGRSPPALP